MFKYLTLLFISFHSWASVYEPNVVWDKSEIEVCFMDETRQKNETQISSYAIIGLLWGINPKPVTSTQSKKVKEALEQEFTQEKTHIQFTGFEKCSETSNADLVVMNNESFVLFNKFEYNIFAGMASIGQSGVQSEFGFVEKSPLKAFMLLKSFEKSVIIHEAGHVLGLRHEHILEEANDDPACNDMSSFVDSESSISDDLFDSTRRYQNYDPDSIMNYCYMKTLKDTNQLDAGLSPQDQELLRSLYSYE
jgi:hypothetical protein